MDNNIIIEMTPFIFEDGNTYYFQIVRRKYTNEYHDIYVYEKIIEEKKGLFGNKTIKEHFKKLNEMPELISVQLDTDEIKKDIKKILISTKAYHQLKNWDGFVGNIPDDVKKQLLRDNKLKNILNG